MPQILNGICNSPDICKKVDCPYHDNDKELTQHYKHYVSLMHSGYEDEVEIGLLPGDCPLVGGNWLKSQIRKYKNKVVITGLCYICQNSRGIDHHLDLVRGQVSRKTVPLCRKCHRKIHYRGPLGFPPELQGRAKDVFFATVEIIKTEGRADIKLKDYTPDKVNKQPPKSLCSISREKLGEALCLMLNELNIAGSIVGTYDLYRAVYSEWNNAKHRTKRGGSDNA